MWRSSPRADEFGRRRESSGTRGLIKIRGAIDGHAFDGVLMAQGDGTHRLPVKARLRSPGFQFVRA